jgi:hypothetical protein
VARIVVFAHEYDSFGDLHLPFSPAARGYLLMRVLHATRDLGHTWKLVKGPKPCAGDVAFLHVDATIVAPEYLALAAKFARAVNFGCPDNSKRKVSDAILAVDDAWSGPVIIKSNLNFEGHREAIHNSMAKRRGRPAPHPGATFTPGYAVLDRKDDVPAEVWGDPTRVVERFIPERVGENYAMRVWLFMGEQERCMRHISAAPIIKGANTLRIETSSVHPDMREKRRQLGFDYGKFDYVEHDGRAYLLDANRTPGAPPREVDTLRNFGWGLHRLISG